MKHFDVVTVHVSAEEGSGPAGPERPGGGLSERDEVVVGAAVEFPAGVAEGIGNGFGGNVFPLGFGAVEEGSEFAGRWGLPPAQLAAEPEEGEDRAHLGVAGAAVADDFPADGILLVSERECRGGEPGQRVRVMQRCGRSGVDFVGDGEVESKR